MKKAFPFVLFFGAATLLFLPFPAYVYVVMPYAEGTNDPDAIEAVAWFGGVFPMLMGVVLFRIAFGIWLYVARQKR